VLYSLLGAPVGPGRPFFHNVFSLASRFDWLFFYAALYIPVALVRIPGAIVHHRLKRRGKLIFIFRCFVIFTANWAIWVITRNLRLKFFVTATAVIFIHCFFSSLTFRNMGCESLMTDSRL
jgi:hypothetical protein